MMNDVIREIQTRRQVGVDQALGLLDMASAMDDSSKRNLLSMAARSLAEPRVQEKWIQATRSETNTELRRDMLWRLCSYDPRRFTNIDAFIDLVLESIEDPEIQNDLLLTLSDLALVHPRVIDKLIDIYPRQKNQSTQWLILLTICQYPNLTDQHLEFLKSITDNVDELIKYFIVDVLLSQDKATDVMLEKWLAVTEPELIQSRVMNYLLDRTKVIEKPLIDLLQKSANPICRIQAIRTLATKRETTLATVQALMQASREDSEEQVQSEALQVLAMLDLNPEIIKELVTRLKEEKSADLVKFMMDMLLPVLEKSPEVRTTLMSMVESGLRADVAVAVYENLEKLFVNQPDLVPFFVKAYQDAKDDRIKNIALRALSKWHKPDQEFTKMYLVALDAPIKEIQNWAVDGLLTTPVTPEYSSLLTQAVGVLLNKEIEKKELLAQKLFCVMEWDDGSIASLQKVIDQTDQSGVKKICTELMDRIKVRKMSSGEKIDIDWDAYYRKVSIKGEAPNSYTDAKFDDKGVIPEIFAFFEEAPEQVIRIAKAAVIRSKEDHNKLALGFLVNKGVIDDDIVRFCWSQALEGKFQYINALRLKPGLSEFKENLWKIVELLTEHTNRYFILEMLRESYGPGDAPLVQEFEKKLKETTNPESLKKIVEFLIENKGWIPSKNLLKNFYLQNRTISDEIKKIVEKELDNMRIDLEKLKSNTGAAQSDGGGLADE